MILGAGGIGMVLETELSTMERKSNSPLPFDVRARLLATQYSNSAYHGAALDRKHIGSELKRFLAEVEIIHGISKAEIASHGVYFSHETCTHASSASSCSGNEVASLRAAFGDDLLSKLLILNTKGFFGHPMGVSFEDVTAVEVLMQQLTDDIKAKAYALYNAQTEGEGVSMADFGNVTKMIGEKIAEIRAAAQ